MWNLQKLLHFTSVAKAGSLSEAARGLEISQPALTTSIKTLERDLGFTLFDRERGFELTPMGRELLPRAEESLKRIRDLEHEIELVHSGEMGELRVACGPAVADGMVGIALARVLALKPKARIRIQVLPFHEIPALLLERKIDLMIGDYSTVERDQRFDLVKLTPERIVLFCRKGHPLAGRSPITAADFFNFPHIAPDLSARSIDWHRGAQPEDAPQKEMMLTCSHYGLINGWSKVEKPSAAHRGPSLPPTSKPVAS